MKHEGGKTNIHPQTKRNKRKTKMKKIMMITCGAMLALAGLAAPSATPCCGFTGEKSCQMWFKGAAAGKISTGVANQTYKTVKALQVKSCQLIIGNDESNTVAVVVVSGTKKGVGSFKYELECTELKWNVFGKNIDKMLAGSTKKSVSLDSELYFKAVDETNNVEVTGCLFGTVKAQASGGCSPCGDPATVKYTPVKFVGQFIGTAPATGCACATELSAALDDCEGCGVTSCLDFVEPDEDQMEYFCGNITLKYDAKNSGCKVR